MRNYTKDDPMYEVKARRGEANLFVTGDKTYAINIPLAISNSVYGKNRKRIALGLHADSRENHIKAMQYLETVQKLISCQSWSALFAFEDGLKPKVVEGNFTRPTLANLWDGYIKAKQDGWEASYLGGDIKAASKVIQSLPDLYLNDTLEPVINYVLEFYPNQAKRYLKQISACLSWGKKRGLVKSNSLPDFLSTMTSRKSKNEDSDIRAFTVIERDAIIKAFREGTFERFKGSHTQYADYIEFLFLTGARTSEALGIKWDHIDLDKKFIIFQEALVMATNGRKSVGVQKRGLKTQKKRVTPISDRLHKMLVERKKQSSSLDENVFSNIDHHSFRAAPYKLVLERLGIDYRKPYQTRHTYITILANYSDLKLHQIAKICGTSTAVIERHYLSTNCDIAKMPDI